MYLKIQRGDEKRVELIQALNHLEQAEYLSGCDLLVWACGYQTSPIPIYDTDKQKLKLSQKVPNTQFDVDQKCRVQLQDGNVLSKVFGCGIAYPVRTKDGMIVGNPTQ